MCACLRMSEEHSPQTPLSLLLQPAGGCLCQGRSIPSVLVCTWWRLLSGLERRLCSCPVNGCRQLTHAFPGQLIYLPAGSHPPLQVPNTCQLAQTPQPRDWSQESQCFLHPSQGLSLALHRTGCLCHLLRGLLLHTLLPPPSVLSWS